MGWCEGVGEGVMMCECEGMQVYKCDSVMVCGCEGVYLCEVLNKVLHSLVQVFSGECGWFRRVQVRDALTQVRGKEVGVETDNIHWVCVEVGGGEKGVERWRVGERCGERKHGREVGREGGWERGGERGREGG